MTQRPNGARPGAGGAGPDRALVAHAADCAARARQRYGDIDYPRLGALLADRQVVRFPVELCFEAGRLEPGEFAHAERIGDHPRAGYRLFVHPHFRERSEDLPGLIAYHLVCVNYGDMATAEVAEVFGATLLGLSQEAYYQRICALADELTVVTADQRPERP